MRYRIIKDEAPPTDDSLRAATLAGEIQALVGPAAAMMYLGEFALACVVANRTGRSSFEELVGETVPDGLWKELEIMGRAEERVELSPSGSVEEQAIHEVLGVPALCCIAGSEGGRSQLEQKLNRCLTDGEWAGLHSHVTEQVPKLQEEWRQMRESGMLALPQSLLAPSPED